MNIKNLMILMFQLICLPVIANNSQDEVEKLYQNYWKKCSNTSLMQSNPKKAREYCNNAIEVDPNNSDISSPYLLKSIITIMLTDELNTNKNKTIFENTYRDLTKVIEKTSSIGQKSQASSYRLFTDLLHKNRYKKYLGNNLCTDLERGLNHKAGRDLTQILIVSHKNIKKECPQKY